MTRARFRQGDMVINSGRLAGYGYIWRVVGYRDLPIGRKILKLLNIGPFRSKREKYDSHIGGIFDRFEDEVQPLPDDDVPVQMSLL